jgi:hypothetical protein
MKLKVSLFVFLGICSAVFAQPQSQNHPTATPLSDNLPVGTVLVSILHFSAFVNEMHDISVAQWSRLNSRWAPADGRDVVGSDYETLTAQTNLPDMRGMFLRGLNRFDGSSARNDGMEDKNGSRTVGDIQTNSTKLGNIFRTNVQAFYGISSAPYGLQYGSGGPVPGPALGDAETRPNNIAVYYYIKINR